MAILATPVNEHRLHDPVLSGVRNKSPQTFIDSQEVLFPSKAYSLVISKLDHLNSLTAVDDKVRDKGYYTNISKTQSFTVIRNKMLSVFMVHCNRKFLS